MALRNDVQKAFERLKGQLKAEQGRKVISSSIMPFEYANGRVMFDAKKTRELTRDLAVHGNVRSVVNAIADEMLELGYPKTFTVGYARSGNMDHVFVFVYTQD